MDIRDISGLDNIVADALSRMNDITLPVIVTTEDIAAEQQTDEELKSLLKNSGELQLKRLRLEGTETTVYCDISTDSIRPYIPKPLRKRIFDVVHNTTHSSGRVTRKNIASKFVWPAMNKDIGEWARTCLQCQRAKISRHVRRKREHIKVPEDRFAHIHLDIVGPLPPSRGYRYCLTMIDRFTRWPEAVPILDITVDTIANAFFGSWDTTHNRVQTAIKCHETTDWVKVLPVVMLGLRNALKEDISTSAAELVYGTQLRIPGEYFSQEEPSQDPFPFLEKLRQAMREIRSRQTAHHNRPRTFTHKTLCTCTHVFLRVNSMRGPLHQLYEGPYAVIERISDFCFRIDIRGQPTDVSIDRLKPAFLETTSGEPPLATYGRTAATSTNTIPKPIQEAARGIRKNVVHLVETNAFKEISTKVPKDKLKDYAQLTERLQFLQMAFCVGNEIILIRIWREAPDQKEKALAVSRTDGAACALSSNAEAATVRAKQIRGNGPGEHVYKKRLSQRKCWSNRKGW
ncbi:uncharacterized protein LOC114936787 [Nylanderia fulva]|uniref:uncharacterized protein LOC114929651 n=1 Tax=Nylanderia fulva TaxID=613905 RepID=UPI0010FB669F|nr:uncharacterized protein LOC114929651 [Nylanderia fulva]XP_029165935.1 uncharacterized protein LOC114936787 [Nylanderia fulva]